MHDPTIVDRLHQLIAALDARTLQPDRPAEDAIVRSAAEMRALAVARLAELGAPSEPGGS